jgi:hypothetical protein
VKKASKILEENSPLTPLKRELSNTSPSSLPHRDEAWVYLLARALSVEASSRFFSFSSESPSPFLLLALAAGLELKVHG